MSEERRQGQAQTDAERAIEAAIARVPLWQGRMASYLPLVGGLMNSNWRVTIDGDACRYFVKIPGPGSELFIDRKTANEAATNAHAR